MRPIAWRHAKVGASTPRAIGYSILPPLRPGGQPTRLSLHAGLIDADDPGLDLARSLGKRGGEGDLWSLARGIELLAPVPEPRQMRDGMSFATHIRQSHEARRRCRR